MYSETIMMTLNLAGHACLWTVLTVAMLTVIIFFFHRKTRRLDYLAAIMVVTPIFVLASYALLMVLADHINICYPPGNVDIRTGTPLLFCDMVTIPVITVFCCAILKAGRIMAIVWAKTADEAKAFQSFGMSLAESFGHLNATLKKEAKKVRSLDFLSLEVEEDV